MTAEWHVEPETWTAYVAGRLGPATEASVEAHVVGCAECRATARGMVDTSSVWAGVQATIGRPQPARPLRLLRRLGVPEDELVLLGAGDGVMVPWIVAVASAVTCALVAGLAPWRPDAVFLALAPLIPALAVVSAFDATESLREVSIPTPYSKLRLALLRTTAALAVAVPVTLMIGLVVPGLSSMTFAWLLPALGLTTAALVLLTWLAPAPVGGALALGWITLAASLGVSDREQLLTGPVAQASYVVAAALLAAVFATRATTLRPRGSER
ncbi:zf-HC2 domain-containing protein [Nocardioides humi]|uniref:Putative zinc-finger domain-containing protein n=1 Tax=Nocardioides humi TaxID=449461 RepID=A0ABN1ZWG7_9ACTN|nr:zf-HC2 domain-containing protein [Nocardioides humi]